MRKRCGGYPDMFRKFYRKNKDITQKFDAVRTGCFIQLTFSFNQTACDCPLPCAQIEYKTCVEKVKV